MQSQVSLQAATPKPPWPMRAWNAARRRLFTPIKLPAWAFYAVAAYRLIPDLFGETDWWWARARDVGGYIGLGAAVIASPYFALCLIGGATAWLLWAGEPKTAMRHPSLRYIGWGIASVIVLGTLAIAEAAYVISLTGTQRHLTLDQQRIITSEARALSPYFYYPDGKRAIGLTVMAVDTPEANAYAIQIMRALIVGKIATVSTPGILAPLPMRLLSPNLRGIFFQVRDIKNKPALEEKVAQIFTDAHISVGYATNPGLKPTDFILSVGLP